MDRKLNSGRLVTRPSPLPYALSGMALSLLCAFLFGEITASLSLLGLSVPGTVHSAELLACILLFLSFLLFWSVTSYSATSGEVSSSVLLFRKNSIHTAYIHQVKVEKRVIDFLMGTRSVSFISRHGRVLMQWHFVRFDAGTARFVRRLGLLLSAVSVEQPGSQPDAS